MHIICFCNFTKYAMNVLLDDNDDDIIYAVAFSWRDLCEVLKTLRITKTHTRRVVLYLSDKLIISKELCFSLVPELESVRYLSSLPEQLDTNEFSRKGCRPLSNRERQCLSFLIGMRSIDVICAATCRRRQDVYHQIELIKQKLHISNRFILYTIAPALQPLLHLK